MLTGYTAVWWVNWSCSKHLLGPFCLVHGQGTLLLTVPLQGPKKVPSGHPGQADLLLGNYFPKGGGGGDEKAWDACRLTLGCKCSIFNHMHTQGVLGEKPIILTVRSRLGWYTEKYTNINSIFSVLVPFRGKKSLSHAQIVLF